MEFMAEFTEGRSRDRARQIIKGKRTKRQRPSSPFSMSTSTTSGNSDCFVDSFTPDQSSVTTSSKEDEDMANCLIMLAQSFSPVKEVKSDYQIREKTESMLSSRRFTEMNGDIVGGGGRACLYVYECKTCNRTFPSFQALGGHRASHKKPKLSVEEKKSSSVNYNYNYTSPPLTEYLEEDHDRDNVIVEDEENKASTETILNNNVQKSPSAPSGFVQTGIISINRNTKSKVHECSICGSEFLSGQALGGHMRKHRPIPPPSVNRTVISTNTDVNHKSTDQIIEKSPSSMLSLDLNFPPPETVADHQSMFQFTANSSQNRIYNSAPAFVDCHY